MSQYRNETDKQTAWIQRQMPLTRQQLETFPTLEGVRLACSVHLSIHVKIAFESILDKGAEVFLTTCNPNTVRDQVVDNLVKRGANAHAWLGMSEDDRIEGIGKALEWQPTHLFEMGADLTSAALEQNSAQSVIAALEVTGSGISRLETLVRQGHQPSFPIFNCDDVPIKEGLHNRHLVGLMTWHTFTTRTMLSLHGKRVLVVGFGLVGQGVAHAARAWGGSVMIAERDPSRMLEAQFASFETGTLESLLPRADVVVTATGVRHVLKASHRGLLKEGCFLINVGHTGDEIEVEALGIRTPVIPFVESLQHQDKEFYLFAGGSMANLVAGQGDSLNSFDITLATMMAGLKYILSYSSANIVTGIQPLPEEAWTKVAQQATVPK